LEDARRKVRDGGNGRQLDAFFARLNAESADLPAEHGVAPDQQACEQLAHGLQR